MDTAQQFLAAYPQHLSGLPRGTHAHLTTSIVDSPWHQSQANSTPSSGTSSQIFINASRRLVDYPSSSPFGDFHAGHQSPSTQTNHAGNAFLTNLSSQIESSSGPVRGVPARRKARMAQVNQSDLTKRGSRETEVTISFTSCLCFRILTRFST